MARSYYARPLQDDVDVFLEYYFRCNSTLENEDTLYNVDCKYDEDLSDTYPILTRSDDATMLCPKTIGNYSFNAGVSENTNIQNHKV